MAINSAGLEAIRRYSTNPSALDKKVLQSMGVPAAHLAAAMASLSSLVQGRVPADMNYLNHVGRTLGMDQRQVREMAKSIAGQPTETERLHAFVTADGSQPANPEVVRFANEFLPSWRAAEFESELTARLDARTAEVDRGQAARLAADPDRAAAAKLKPERDPALEAANDAKHRRWLIEQQLGGQKDQGFAARRARAADASAKLADRIDAGMTSMTNPEADLHSTLRDAYDLSKVNAERKDLGMGDVIAEQRDYAEQIAHVVDENFDVTKDL